MLKAYLTNERTNAQTNALTHKRTHKQVEPAAAIAEPPPARPGTVEVGPGGGIGRRRGLKPPSPRGGV